MKTVKIIKSLLRMRQSAVFILMLGVTMSACASTTWKEEVLLQDGSKIIAQRSQSYGGRHEIGQSSPIKEQEITFTVPAMKKTFNFKSEFSEDIGRANFKLLALHILNDAPYIVASPNLCLSYNKWGRPNPPYVIFRHDGKTWQRIPLSDLPIEFRDINLVIETKGEKKILTAQPLVTAELVKKLNGQLSQPEYKTILREEVKKSLGLTTCPIPSTAAAKLIAPEIDGKPLYYNWWPLAKDWLNKPYGGNK